MIHFLFGLLVIYTTCFPFSEDLRILKSWGIKDPQILRISKSLNSKDFEILKIWGPLIPQDLRILKSPELGTPTPQKNLKYEMPLKISEIIKYKIWNMKKIIVNCEKEPIICIFSSSQKSSADKKVKVTLKWYCHSRYPTQPKNYWRNSGGMLWQKETNRRQKRKRRNRKKRRKRRQSCENVPTMTTCWC